MTTGGNVILLDEPTNDLDIETLQNLEDALEPFAGCAVVISHDRWFPGRLCTHILAFEGDSHVEWFEGAFEAYEEDKKRRLGADSLIPKRIKFQKFGRWGVSAADAGDCSSPLRCLPWPAALDAVGPRRGGFCRRPRTTGNPSHVGPRTEDAGEQARDRKVRVQRFPMQAEAGAEDFHGGEIVVAG